MAIGTPPSIGPTRAGVNLRSWRQRNRISAEQLGKTLGDMLGIEPVPAVTLYGWETRGKDPRPMVRKALTQLGACAPADWNEPAHKDDSPHGNGKVAARG